MIRRHLKPVAIGLAAGVTGGLFGVGGGVIAVPGLVLLLGMDQHRAHATSLAAITGTASAAALPFVLSNEVNWPAALFLVVGASLGAALGARWMPSIRPRPLAIGFLLLTVAAAVRMLFWTGEGLAGASPLEGPLELVAFVAMGLFAGTVAAMLGVGGGVIYVPALVVIFGLDQHLAQGTSLVTIIPTMVIATMVNARRDLVDWEKAGAVGLAGIAAGLAGGFLALELAAPTLQRLFALFLIVVSGRMVARVIADRPVRR